MSTVSSFRRLCLCSCAVASALLVSRTSSADETYGSQSPEATPPASTMPGAGSSPYGPYGTPPSSTTTPSGATMPSGTTTTTAAPYAYETEPVPGAERAELRRPNLPILAAGGLTFAAAYLTPGIVSAASDDSDDNEVWIPLAGPWIVLGQRDCGADCDAEDTWSSIGLVAAGVGQAAGVGLAIASAFIPQRTGQGAFGGARERDKRAASRPEVHVTPISVRAGAGIGAVGTF